jgi:membrane glycosyltransferase
MATSISATPAPNALYLQREVSLRLQSEFDAANRTYYEMSQMRNRTTIQNHDDFIRRHKEIFIESIHLEADLKRSKAKEAALIRVMARQHEVGVA